MTKDEKLILAEMLDMLHKVAASTAALETVLTSGALGGVPLSPVQLTDLRQREAKQQQQTFQALAVRIRDLPNT